MEVPVGENPRTSLGAGRTATASSSPSCAPLKRDSFRAVDPAAGPTTGSGGTARPRATKDCWRMAT
jgi:hypothetical protein